MKTKQKLQNISQRDFNPASGYYRFDPSTADIQKRNYVFGYTRENEVTNGRLAMFGISFGLVREKMTGQSILDQVGLAGNHVGQVAVFSILMFGMTVAVYTWMEKLKNQSFIQ